MGKASIGRNLGVGLKDESEAIQSSAGQAFWAEGAACVVG